MGDRYIGEIKLVSFNFAPQGWAFCNGQLLPINQNQALFSLLGTNYGGNGTTNFALPDLRGRVPVGAGTGPGLTSRLEGDKGGLEATTLTVDQLPAHSHLVDASAGPALLASPQGNFPAATRGPAYSPLSAADTSLHPSTVANAPGSPTPLALPQPTRVMNYIIALQGIFPSPS